MGLVPVLVVKMLISTFRDPESGYLVLHYAFNNPWGDLKHATWMWLYMVLSLIQKSVLVQLLSGKAKTVLGAS